MSDREDGSGRRAFLGLAAMILGGLLFAAGVMVGRHMSTGEAASHGDRLSRIDQRDRPGPSILDGDTLQFPTVLNEPDMNLREPGGPKVIKVPVPHKVVTESADAGISSGTAAPDAGVPVSVASADPGPQPSDPGSVLVAPVPAGADAAGGGKRFALQVAAFKERAQAQALVDKLSARGYPPAKVLESVTGSKGAYFRVRLGSFSDRASAEEMGRKLLAEDKLKVLVVSEE